MKGVLTCVLCMAVLGVLDGATTLLGVGRGVFREVNPLLRNALELHAGWFILLKGGLTLLWASVTLREKRCRWLMRMNLGILGAYTAVVGRSLWLLFA